MLIGKEPIMNKPYTSEIIKAMATYSDGCSAYASAMKWDFWRRQKVEDVTTDDIRGDCAFCIKWNKLTCKEVCLLGIKQKGQCTANHTYYSKVWNAIEAKDQQAFTTAANNLYYQIRSIIDDLYKPEPKKEEVFYRVGQRFRNTESKIYRLSKVGNYLASMTREDGSNCWTEPVRVKSTSRITEYEFRSIITTGTFTPIPEDKK